MKSYRLGSRSNSESSLDVASAHFAVWGTGVLHGERRSRTDCQDKAT